MSWDNWLFDLRVLGLVENSTGKFTDLLLTCVLKDIDLQSKQELLKKKKK